MAEILNMRAHAFRLPVTGEIEGIDGIAVPGQVVRQISKTPGVGTPAVDANDHRAGVSRVRPPFLGVQGQAAAHELKGFVTRHVGSR